MSGAVPPGGAHRRQQLVQCLLARVDRPLRQDWKISIVIPRQQSRLRPNATPAM